MANTMAYLETGSTKTSVKAVKQHLTKEMDTFSSTTILLYLVIRHKLLLITTWAIVMTLLYLMPFLPDVISSIL